MINRVFIQTFGEFDVFVDGRKIAFRHPKSKEVLAVLVDKRGLSMSRPEIFSVVWEDRFYDRAMQSQFDTLIRSMRRTLNSNYRALRATYHQGLDGMHKGHPRNGNHIHS